MDKFARFYVYVVVMVIICIIIEGMKKRYAKDIQKSIPFNRSFSFCNHCIVNRVSCHGVCQ